MILCALAVSTLFGQVAAPVVFPAPTCAVTSACGGLDQVAPQAGSYGPRTPWQRFRMRAILRDGESKRAAHVGAAVPCDPVAMVADLPYGCDACQRLDLYLPACRGYPVVVFLHGGSWISEDKSMYAVLGRYLAAHRVGAALINYHLPPLANVDTQVADSAAAIAWVHAHVAGYGGDPGRLFVCGHSSGAHLAAVLGTNACYLRRVGLCPSELRGVIGIGGVYNVGLNTRLFGVAYAFRDTDHRALSPSRHIDCCPPPVLLLDAECDAFYMKRHARVFAHRLEAHDCAVESHVVPCNDHYGMVLDIAMPGRQQGPILLDFIARH